MTGQLLPLHPVVDVDRPAALEASNILDTAPELGVDGVVLLTGMLCAAPAALLSFVAEDRSGSKPASGSVLRARLAAE